MRGWGLWWLWLVACGGGGAGDAGGPPGDDAGIDAGTDDTCFDLDSDGAGVGGNCARQDCDDTDPETIDECGLDCEARPLRAGCPCGDAGDAVPCFMGPPGTDPVGPCQEGRKECTTSGWGRCEGQALPRDPETCNEVDDDCDGTIDDGVLNACGGCGGCLCVGGGAEGPFPPPFDAAITMNEDGSVTLNPDWRGEPALWVANTGDGTVSKLDPRARVEVGRYRTSANPAGAPSAVAVDLHGDVVVVNRADRSATKIEGRDCRDGDGDGDIETSTAGDDVRAWSADDCVRWSTPDLGDVSSVAFEARAELDGAVTERVWIGGALDGEGSIVELESATGERTGIEVAGTDAFALAMGPGGLLWSVGRDGCPVSTDTTTLEQVQAPCPPGGSAASALAVDARGRVWMSGRVARFDPDLGLWDEPVVPTTSTGLTLDLRGDAYTGEGAAGGYRIDADTLEATALPSMSGRAWAEDVDALVWSFDVDTNGAHVLDPSTGIVEDVVPPFDRPDGAGDPTGTALWRVTPPSGRLHSAFETCPPNYYREGLRLDYVADLPAGTSIAFRVRQAWSEESLVHGPWIAAGTAPAASTPIDVGAAFEAAGWEPATWVEVEAVLRGVDGVELPTLRSMCLVWDSCWIE